MRIEEILGLPLSSEDPFFKFLPVRTNFEEEMQKSSKLVNKEFKPKIGGKQKEEGLEQWGGMKKGDIQQYRSQLQLLRVNQFLDPKVHVAHNKQQKLPKYFQVGVLQGSGRRERAKAKGRRSSLAQRYLQQDAERGYSRRKFNEIEQRRKRIRKIKH